MRITADTNVLVRAAVMDDPSQSAAAVAALVEADLVRGGFFAGVVIAFEGRRAGGGVFTSFDRDAAALG